LNQTAVRKQTTGVVASMTGYGNGSLEVEVGGQAGVASCEVRTVNSRFVDIQLRLADELRALEPMLRESAGRHFARGKIECRLSWRAARSSSATVKLDDALLEQLLAAERRIRERHPSAGPLTVADILRLHEGGADPVAELRGDGAEAATSLQGALAPLVEQVFGECLAARRREGARLGDVIRHHLDAMQTVCDALRPRIPALLADAQERLSARLAEALPTEGVMVGRDETFARVRQEVALLSLRGDVAEELDRLEAHLAEARQVLAEGGTVGKRLDFLSQEMNREANTIASKAIAIAVTDAAVTLKLSIEQLREQVQNIE
jgi:uncharacterized protein (TIGR00255 family)